MPYLEPDEIVRRFSGFALEEVRPEIEDEFVRAQVGSMASTLRFLSGELQGMDDAVEAQHGALVSAFDALEEDEALTEAEGGEKVLEAVGEARDLMDAEAGTRELEADLVAACEDVLAVIEEEQEERRLGDEEARSARRPLYDFLDTRVQSQLMMCGKGR